MGRRTNAKTPSRDVGKSIIAGALGKTVGNVAKLTQSAQPVKLQSQTKPATSAKTQSQTKPATSAKTQSQTKPATSAKTQNVVAASSYLTGGSPTTGGTPYGAGPQARQQEAQKAQPQPEAAQIWAEKTWTDKELKKASAQRAEERAAEAPTRTQSQTKTPPQPEPQTQSQPITSMKTQTQSKPTTSMKTQTQSQPVGSGALKVLEGKLQAERDVKYAGRDKLLAQKVPMGLSAIKELDRGLQAQRDYGVYKATGEAPSDPKQIQGMQRLAEKELEEARERERKAGAAYQAATGPASTYLTGGGQGRAGLGPTPTEYGGRGQSPAPTGRKELDDLLTAQRVRMEAKGRTRDLDEVYAGAVEREKWDAMPTDLDEMHTRMDSTVADQDRIEEEMHKLWEQIYAIGGDPTRAEEAAELTARYKALAQDYNDRDAQMVRLGSYEYTQRNEQAFGRMSGDAEAAVRYMSAQAIQSDMDKLMAVAKYYQDGSGDIATMRGYMDELKERYGIEAQAFADYANRGMEAEGPGSVREVYALLEGRLGEVSGQLKDQGYDYRDMTKYAQRVEQQQERAKRDAEHAEYAKEHPVLASIGSVAGAPFQLLDLTKMDWGHGKPGDPDYVPPDASAMEIVSYVNTVRGTVGRKIETETELELFGRNVGSFLYQTGMSTVDSGLSIATLGPGAVYLMGANAATATAKDVADRGGTGTQAFWAGLAAGAAEVLFEKVSVDRLLEPKTVTGWKDAVMEYVVKQGGVELSEETCTEIANILTDTVIMGGNSNYAHAVETYRAQGMTTEQAQRQAYLDQIGQVAEAGVGGFISGGLMGGAKGVVDYVAQQLGGYHNNTVPQLGTVSTLPKMTMADFIDVNSPVWRKVDYEDAESQRQITLETHQQMINEGQVVQIPEETIQQVDQSFPDLRTMKKTERTQLFKQKMKELKATMQRFLNGLKETPFEFVVNGSILEATLYGTGIREVTEKITQDKASMLYHSGEIFRNAQYLYSTPDYGGDPNIYRWNYFYTPVRIGEQVVGVRIAVRDLANPQESQIYHWGIKKDTPVDGGGRGQGRIPTGVSLGVPGSMSLGIEQPGISASSPGASSDIASINNIPQTTEDVNAQDVSQERETPPDETILTFLKEQEEQGKRYSRLERRVELGVVSEELGQRLALPFGATSDAERQQAVSQILDKVFSGRRTEKTAEAEGETESGLTLDETPDKIMPTQTIPDHILGEEGYLQQRLDYMWNGERLVIPQYTSFDKAITIAGEGTGIPIRDVDRLVEIYHRPAETWKKRAAKVTSAQYVFDIHWYESDDGVQYEVKLKNRSEIK